MADGKQQFSDNKGMINVCVNFKFFAYLSHGS